MPIGFEPECIGSGVLQCQWALKNQLVRFQVQAGRLKFDAILLLTIGDALPTLEQARERRLLGCAHAVREAVQLIGSPRAGYSDQEHWAVVDATNRTARSGARLCAIAGRLSTNDLSVPTTD